MALASTIFAINLQVRHTSVALQVVLPCTRTNLHFATPCRLRRRSQISRLPALPSLHTLLRPRYLAAPHQAMRPSFEASGWVVPHCALRQTAS